MYKPPLDKNDLMLRELQREDYTLPLSMRVIPVKVEPPILPADPRLEAPELPRTAIVRNLFLGAVEGLANFAKL